MTLTVTLPDGNALELPDGATGADAASIVVVVRGRKIELDLGRFHETRSGQQTPERAGH